MTRTIDAKTAKGAATATVKALNKEAVKMGASPTASVRSGFRFGGHFYYVSWEEGPSSWSTLATGKGNIWGEESTGSLTKAYNMPATIDFKYAYGNGDLSFGSGRYFVECENSYTLIFGRN